MAPGNNWVGSTRGVSQGYHINTAIDAVRIWNASNPALGSWGAYTTPGAYPAGQLYKNITSDEHGKQVIEFKDKSGQVILKKVQLTAANDNGQGSGHDGWICTYYIYDDFGSLRCVVQPEGVKWLSTNGWNLSNATILAEQCFRYEYDQRRRMIMKKVPGAAEVTMVYDARDRLVATQDGNLGAQGKWLYTWYDALNRPYATGLWTIGGTTGTPGSRWLVRANEANTYTTEYPATGTGSREELTLNFYDNYNWLSGYSGHGLSSSFENETGIDPAENNSAYPYVRPLAGSTMTHGMPTGSRTKILGTSSWITSLVVYDADGRVIQTKTHNAQDSVTERTTIQYGFAGQVHHTATRQSKIGANAQHLVTHSLHQYDAIGRVKTIKKRQAHSQLNNDSLSAEKTIDSLQYDALGQLKKKHLGQKPGASAGTPLESLTYDYNIRGWLLGVNRDLLKTTTQVTPGVSNWFGFELGYDKSPQTAGGTFWRSNQFNGNIKGMLWRTTGDGQHRQYHYLYDAANRLLTADFEQRNANGTWDPSAMDFSFWTDHTGASNGAVAYDLNGNLQKMGHRGFKPGATGYWPRNIDVLDYEYLPNSNRLKKVTDQITTPQGQGDFTDGNLGDTDYYYDANGNMTRDLNKGIGTQGANGITYNHLNLPQVIQVHQPGTSTSKGTITYTYDAGGAKLKKTVVEQGVTIGSTSNITVTTTTQYLGGAVYESK
ncbi:MAG TPA: hypothetical protein VK907_11030, partial [Phnomibacter sp.]|nr:hypothetical protein [Phnomibacter sp.]